MLLELKDEMQERRLVVLRPRQSPKHCGETREGDARKFHLGGNDYDYRSFVFELIKTVIFVIDCGTFLNYFEA